MSSVWDYVSFDVCEVEEWRSAFLSVITHNSLAQAQELLQIQLDLIRKNGVVESQDAITSPVNTLPTSKNVPVQTDEEKQALSLIQWNAMMMVVRAGKRGVETAGHIATYASASTLIETGMNYFFHAETKDH